jgi:curved DNA-binding protein CbpA
MKNYYQILEIPPDASQDIIKEQYRFLVQAWHPDKFPNPAQKIKAEEKIKEIIAAYEILRDPIKRAEFDRIINAKRASTTSDKTAEEAKQRADQERRRKEEAENNRRRAEREYADEERRRREEAKRRADEEKKRKEEAENRHQRSEQNKEAFRSYANEERQRREKAKQGLNQVNPNQSSQLIRVLVTLFILLFVTVLFATFFNFLGIHAIMTRQVLSPTSPPPTQTLQQSSQTDAIASAIVIPTYVSTSIDPTITQNIIFKDDFQVSSTTRVNWSSLGGTWIIEDGVLSCIANGKYLANITLPEDFTFQLDIMGINVIDKIIIFRSIDDSTGYGIDFRTTPYNDIVLVKSLPGNVGQIIQTVPFDNNNNTWYTIKVDVENNHIKVFVNDQPTIDFIDTSSPIKDGTVGVGAMLQPGFSVVYYDNIVITHR